MAVKSKSRQTRFPVARIKKIMQKDDEVGKVAQATPVLISKALEIFMQKLVDEAAREAQSKGSRKVAAYHLKRTIEAIDMFDFLKDLVAVVPDPGDKPHKKEEEVGPDGEPKKRRGRGKGKAKKKQESSDEEEEEDDHEEMEEDDD
ncbi:histone-fold-containing protein [Calocera viscosa TUFC12733]|uniref:Histone-fold-containing protein n=1 Tax=Calocera viscosa (strain TUFC12733) TaxID=1330018 RepID=A0A167N6H8_CALVF|nr:histone-fold-containing protein [Calocera viscosa TUFC12733]